MSLAATSTSLCQLGNLAFAKHQLKQAETYFHQALSLDPDFVPAHHNLAFIAMSQGKSEIALKHLLKLSRLLPLSASSFYNLGLVYQLRGEFTHARQALLQCLWLDPHYVKAYADLYYAARCACDFETAQTAEGPMLEHHVETPFINLLRSEDPQNNLQVTQTVVATFAQKVPPSPYMHLPRSQQPKIRLGYLSRDFRDHPVGQMVSGLFNHHDRQQFEVFAFSYGPNDGSEWRHQVETGADRFFDLEFTHDRQAAQIIYDLKIDILIDLAGHTQGARLGIAALKPAPIQISWLGFPGTTGSPYFDHLLADAIVCPPAEDRNFTEKIIRLSGCYQVNATHPPISRNTYQKSDFHLPPDAFVFGSFNQAFKFDREMFTLWLDLLQQVPGSVLWLWDYGRETAQNLKRFAKQQGVHPRRLVFSSRLPNAEHVTRLSLTDLALDTRIYGGHTTTSDYLRAGVPVVTCLGNHFASRVAASILATYGVPELVTPDLESYRQLAVHYATHPQALKNLKSKILNLKSHNPLFDTAAFARKLESVYLTLIKKLG